METIQSPNTSGQGFCPAHADSAYHRIAIEFGYAYSHSTPVTFLTGRRVVLHTYKQGNHHLSFGQDTATAWATSCTTASGRRWEGFGSARLSRHLAGKRQRYADLRPLRGGTDEGDGADLYEKVTGQYPRRQDR